jgi:hypothetical protein
VTIDTEARTGPAKSLNQTERRTSALAPDFFDTIDPTETSSFPIGDAASHVMRIEK